MPIKEPTRFAVPLWLVGPAWPEGHPVRIGVPLPRGTIRREELVRLVDAEGRPVRLQTEVLARWPDESIQWLLVDFWAYKNQPERQTWHLQVGRVGPAEPLEDGGQKAEERTVMGEERPESPHPASFGSRLSPQGERPEPPHPGPSPTEGRGNRPAIRIEDQAPVLWVDTGSVQFGLDERHLYPLRWVRSKKAASSPADPKAEPGFPSEPVAETKTQLQLAGGRLREAQIDGWRVESAGPVRLTLRTEGHFRRAKGVRVRARVSFFAGTGLVWYQLTVHNPRRARHRGGLWDLGDPGSVFIKDLSVWVRLAKPARQAAIRIEPPGPVLDLTEALQQGSWRLYQDSSGGANWQSPNHVNRLGRVPCRLPGYETNLIPLSTVGEGGLQSRLGEGAFHPPPSVHLPPPSADSPSPGQPEGWPASPTEGRGENIPSPPPLSRSGKRGELRRALPVAALQTDQLLLAAAVPEFWQQFPKTLQIERQAIRIGLWPAEWDDLHELQGGERKTHTLWLDFAAVETALPNPPDSSVHPSEQIGPNLPSPLPETEGSPPNPSSPSEVGQKPLSKAVHRLAWVHEPIQVLLPPEVWQAAGVLPHFIPSGHEAAGRLDALLTEAIAGPESLLTRREVIDEYGWRHYGDLYADHENAHYPGPKPVISHYNNQFDVIYGAILQEARTGNPAWRALYDPLARHVMDIDLYHTQQDRPAYNGGLFWPTDHYRCAHTATHRTYSRQNKPPNDTPYGGGPGPEHNYATGLLFYYYLTGNRDAGEAIEQLAGWVLQMDDGRQTPWGLLDPGPTGLASATRSPDYHGPGRGAANSILTLLDAWQLTGQRKYLSKAEELIRRTIHPADQIVRHRLLDAENRWSYTMYLSALARYLEMKIQQEELDAMYRYGQAALVHYGAWMAEQERPFLDHPEQLEYVTEAWPAQELRKANAMRLAARHAEEPLRQRLLQRAAELADRAWSDWASFPTRMSTRALAVLLVEGVRDAYYQVVSDPPAPRIGGPKHFGVPEPFVPQQERVRRLLRQPAGWIRLGWALVQPGNWCRLIESLWRYRN